MRAPLLSLLLAVALISGAIPSGAKAMEKRESEMRNPATISIALLPHARRMTVDTRLAQHHIDERSHAKVSQPLAACCFAALVSPEPTVIVLSADTAAQAASAEPAPQPKAEAAKSHDAPPSSEIVAGVTIIRGAASSSR